MNIDIEAYEWFRSWLGVFKRWANEWSYAEWKAQIYRRDLDLSKSKACWIFATLRSNVKHWPPHERGPGWLTKAEWNEVTELNYAKLMVSLWFRSWLGVFKRWANEWSYAEWKAQIYRRDLDLSKSKACWIFATLRSNVKHWPPHERGPGWLTKAEWNEVFLCFFLLNSIYSLLKRIYAYMRYMYIP